MLRSAADNEKAMTIEQQRELAQSFLHNALQAEHIDRLTEQAYRDVSDVESRWLKAFRENYYGCVVALGPEDKTLTIREAYEKLEALRRELGYGSVFQTIGKHSTRLEFILHLPNDNSMKPVRVPEPPPERASDD